MWTQMIITIIQGLIRAVSPQLWRFKPQWNVNTNNNNNNSKFNTCCISSVMKIQSAVKCHCYLTQQQHTNLFTIMTHKQQCVYNKSVYSNLTKTNRSLTYNCMFSFQYLYKISFSVLLYYSWSKNVQVKKTHSDQYARVPKHGGSLSYWKHVFFMITSPFLSLSSAPQENHYWKTNFKSST
jgi:hypothetical protein